MTGVATAKADCWQFSWQPSRYLLLLRIVLPCLALGALSLTSWSGFVLSGFSSAAWWQNLLFLISMLSLPVMAVHTWYVHRHQPVGLFAESNDLTVVLSSGRRIAVRAARVYCLSWLQVLRLRCWRGHYYTLVVLPDSGDQDQRHQWRYFLRYELTG